MRKKTGEAARLFPFPFSIWKLGTTVGEKTSSESGEDECYGCFNSYAITLTCICTTVPVLLPKAALSNTDR